MSARFAIPATTFVLKSMIEQELKAAYTPATAPTVLVSPPPRPAATSPAGGGGAPAASDKEAPAVYLYMHHVATNPAYRSMLVPYRESGGDLSTRSPLVLDLHYLLAATGAGLERETLLGLAMTAFHRRPIMPRADVLAIFTALSSPDPHSTDPMDGLIDEPLWRAGEHPESIKISQNPLDVDLSTKLWSALQSPIRPSAYYLVTTTFLDTNLSAPDGPPVTETTVTARAVANPADDLAQRIALTDAEPVP